MRDSHVGGPMLWPYGDPWPVCSEPHQLETGGYAPDEIRSARAVGTWPESRRGPAPARRGKADRRRSWGSRSSSAGMSRAWRPGPDNADLVQLFRCPYTHMSHQEYRCHLRWRRAAETESAERFLMSPPEVPLLRWENELPQPCVLHPEEVDTYPWAEGDTLPAPLIDLIDAWDDAQAAEHGPEALNYPCDLSIPPGWRVGGYPS